jgi:RimJ/RimL family protein N-acetyltransferase
MATFEPRRQTLRDGREATVRNLVPSDAPAFVEFHRFVSQETQFTMQRPEEPATVEKSEKRFATMQADPESLMLGVFAGDDGATELAGILGLHPYWPGHPWVLHLRSFGMMVRQAYWGSGASHLLMRAMFDFANDHGIRRIEGRVRVTNARGMRFYERMGFVVEGTHPVGAHIDGRDVAEHTVARVRALSEKF